MSSRYSILGHLAKGGMASVYLGRMTGSAGFSRLVAIKRLHPELAAEREFVAMLVDEARLAAQIRHTNVIDTLDFIVNDGAFSLVLEYIDGDSLSVLMKAAKREGETIPLSIALAIMHGVLRGLDAAHEARGEDGHPLGAIHRDVSPQNVLVGIDGIPRVIDFGIAKAVGRFDTTKPGEIRGKFAYMAPEQLLAKPVTRQVDVYAAGVILWELLTGRRPFAGEDERAVCAAVLRNEIEAPSKYNAEVSAELDEIVLKAMSQDLGRRHLTARELLADLEPFKRASDEDVAAWVRRLTVDKRARRQRLVEGDASNPDLRSLEDVMRELGGPVPSSPSPASASAVAVAPRPRPQSKLPWIAAAVAIALVIGGVSLVLRKSPPPAPPEPTTASSTFPPPPIVVTSEFVDPATPSASASTTSASAPSAKPTRKPTTKPVAQPDPASFR